MSRILAILSVDDSRARRKKSMAASIFVSRETFEEMIAAGEFLEWACVHGNFYGTAKTQIQAGDGAGADIILEVDVQGARERAQIADGLGEYSLSCRRPTRS